MCWLHFKLLQKYTREGLFLFVLFFLRLNSYSALDWIPLRRFAPNEREQKSYIIVHTCFQ